MKNSCFFRSLQSSSVASRTRQSGHCCCFICALTVSSAQTMQAAAQCAWGSQLGMHQHMCIITMTFPCTASCRNSGVLWGKPYLTKRTVSLQKDSSQLGPGTTSAHRGNRWWGRVTLSVKWNSKSAAVTSVSSRITHEDVKSGVNLPGKTEVVLLFHCWAGFYFLKSHWYQKYNNTTMITIIKSMKNNLIIFANSLVLLKLLKYCLIINMKY